MATVAELQTALDNLLNNPLSFDASSLLPDKTTILKGLLSKSIPMSAGETALEYDQKLTQMAEGASTSFMGAMVDKEINTLKGNLSTFMDTVPPLAVNIVTQITSAAVPPTTATVPSIISGIKSQIGMLTQQAASILNSCVFLNIELPDSIVDVMNSLGIIKTGLDAIPI